MPNPHEDTSFASNAEGNQPRAADHRFVTRGVLYATLNPAPPSGLPPECFRASFQSWLSVLLGLCASEPQLCPASLWAYTQALQQIGDSRDVQVLHSLGVVLPAICDFLQEKRETCFTGSFA